MNIVYLLLAGGLLAAPYAAAQDAQDWQDFRKDGGYSFRDVKDSVRRVTTDHGYSGWDEKRFNRAGDLTSVAILQTVDDAQMTAPEVLRDILAIVRDAFACPARCVATASDREPRVTLLLLEHLHNHTSGKMQLDVDETTRFLIAQRATDTH
jgi:hypothetical protein